MGGKVSRSVRFDRETVEEIEEIVEDSYLFENFSHFVRTAVGSFREEGEWDDDFESAQ